MGKIISNNVINNHFAEDERYFELPFNLTYISAVVDHYSYEQRFDIKYPYHSNNIIPNATVITAHFPVENNDGKYIFTYERIIKKISDTSLLASLINLRLNLSEKLFKPFNHISKLITIDTQSYDYIKQTMFKTQARASYNNLNSIEPMIVQKDDLNKIALWCKKYGYPYTIENSMLYDIAKDMPRLNTPHVNRRVVIKTFRTPQISINFWVWDFLRRLQIFYLTFIMFYKLAGRKQELDEIGVKDIWSTYDSPTPQKYNDMIKVIYDTISIKSIPNFEFAENIYSNYKAPIEFYTDNVFDLAMYMLFFFVKSNRSHLKQCPSCLEFFVPMRRNQKYCHAMEYLKDEKGNVIIDAQGENVAKSKLGKCYPQLINKRKKLAEKKKSKTSE